MIQKILTFFIMLVSCLGAFPLQYQLIYGMPNVYIDPNSEAIGKTWLKGKVWDQELIEKFFSILKSRKDSFVVLDLGAQTGSFSLLAKFFPCSQWYAFEPLEEAATTLKNNLLLNCIYNVSIQPYAVSNYTGKAVLKMPEKGEWGLSTIGSNPLRFNPITQRQVDCVDLDHFVKTHRIHKVDFIKADTEGSELLILQGAKQLLLRDKPIILMEYNETNMKQCNVSKEEVDLFLKELDYSWSLVSSEDILCTPNKAQEVITNPLRWDGFGAQFQFIIYAVIYAELNNKKFQYSPFREMEHNYNNDPNFIKNKENLINFIGNFEINENINLQYPPKNQEYCEFFESHLAECANSQSLKRIKELFREGKDKDKYFANDRLNIAVHIRRPNSHDSRIDGTDVADETYLNIINSLRTKFGTQNPLFHIYSQGNLETFKAIYSSDDIAFHINDSIEDTFTSMVLADVLVTTASSMSYAAGMLSEGQVYYIPFWHPPLPGWTVCEILTKDLQS